MSPLWTVVSFFFQIAMLLCVSPLFGLGPIKALIKKTFYTLSSSPGEFDYFFDYDSDGDDYSDDIDSDQWETYRYLGTIAIVPVLAIALYLSYSILTTWLRTHIGWIPEPFYAMPSQPDAVNTHETPRGNGTHDYSLTAAHITDAFFTASASRQAQRRVLPPPTAKPFPYKNFGLGDRERPFENPKPFSPIPSTRLITLIDKDYKVESGEVSIEKDVDPSQSGKEDTSMADASTVGALQYVIEPDKEDISMADASIIAVTGKAEALTDPLTAAHDEPNNTEAVQPTQKFVTMVGVSLEGFQQLRTASNSGPHQTGYLPATPQHGGWSAVQTVPTSTFPQLPPSPKQLLGIALNKLELRKTGLLAAIEQFYRVIEGSRTYEDEVVAILEWLQDAEEELKPHIRHAQFADLIECHSWFRALRYLYNYLQQRTDLYIAQGVLDLLEFAEKISGFGHRLQPSIPPPIINQPPAPLVTAPQQPPIIDNFSESLRTVRPTAAAPMNLDFGASALKFEISKDDFTPVYGRQPIARRPGVPRLRVTRTSPIGRSAIAKPSPPGSPSRCSTHRIPSKPLNVERTFEDDLADCFAAEGSW